MKILAFRHIAFIMVFSFLSFVASAADYYVVIGAFSNEVNAHVFSENMRRRFPKVSYSVNQKGKLYYVHVLRTEEKDQALTLVLTLQSEARFKDAWIFSESNEASPAEAVSSVRESMQADRAEVSRAEAMWSEINDLNFITGIKDVSAAREAVVISSGDLFTFIVENDGKTIPTEILLAPTAKTNPALKLNTGEYVALRSKKRNEMLKVVCDVVGYRRKEIVFNLQDIERAKNVDKNSEGVWEVRLKLEKMVTNDIAVLKDTFFREDAALLDSASGTDLDELITMMKENPGYKIMMHIHCNKGSKRAIELPGSNGDCFDARNPVVKSGSDKTLTKERGKVLRNYLVQAGINRKRIQYIGWGSVGMPEVRPNATTKMQEVVEVELMQAGGRKSGGNSQILLSGR